MNRSEPHCVVRTPHLLVAACLFSATREVHITHLYGRRGMVMFAERDDGGVMLTWDKHGFPRNFHHSDHQAYVFRSDESVSFRHHIRGPDFEYDVLLSTECDMTLTERATAKTWTLPAERLRLEEASRLYSSLLRLTRMPYSMTTSSSVSLLNASTLTSVGQIADFLDAIVEIRATPNTPHGPNVVMQTRGGRPLPLVIVPNIGEHKMPRDQYDAKSLGDRLMEYFHERDLLRDATSHDNVVPLRARHRSHVTAAS